MARQRILIVLVALASSLILADSAILKCEDLPADFCAFSVSSFGERCVLENTILDEERIEYKCQASSVTAHEFVEWVETDECVESCGLERMSVGMSSDFLVENVFSRSLCSALCKDVCPNIFDLYTKIAAGEGVALSQLCDAFRGRREMLKYGIASKSKDTIDGATYKISPGPESQSTAAIFIASSPAAA